MKRDIAAAFGLILAASTPATAADRTGELAFGLTYLDRFDVEDEDAGLDEPSGLALSANGDALWTVDDEHGKIFEIDLEGELLDERALAIADEDLEGLAFDPASGTFALVRETPPEILLVDGASNRPIARRRLSEMRGFGAIERYFSGDDAADVGLEGVTFHAERGSLFVLKEHSPGLLIELSRDLQAIRSVRVLGAANGFLDDDVEPHRIDFSGLHHDPARDAFWIVSDRARRLYLYDRDQDHVLQSAALGYARGGAYREIEKAEGVTVDPGAHRLYAVSDDESRLYVFDLR